MIHVILDKPSSAAAQGEQASEPHHADGYIFTGPDPSVQTPDASEEPRTRIAVRQSDFDDPDYMA